MKYKLSIVHAVMKISIKIYSNWCGWVLVVITHHPIDGLIINFTSPCSASKLHGHMGSKKKKRSFDVQIMFDILAQVNDDTSTIIGHRCVNVQYFGSS